MSSIRRTVRYCLKNILTRGSQTLYILHYTIHTNTHIHTFFIYCWRHAVRPHTYLDLNKFILLDCRCFGICKAPDKMFAARTPITMKKQLFRSRKQCAFGSKLIGFSQCPQRFVKTIQGVPRTFYECKNFCTFQNCKKKTKLN